MAQNDDLLPGTLDVLVLRYSPGHAAWVGHCPAAEAAVAGRAFRAAGVAVSRSAQDGGRGWISAEWKATDEGRQAKFYALTARGRKQLAEARARWVRLSSAVGLVLDIAQD